MYPSASFAGLSRWSGCSGSDRSRTPMTPIGAALKAAGSAQSAAGSGSAATAPKTVAMRPSPTSISPAAVLPPSPGASPPPPAEPCCGGSCGSATGHSRCSTAALRRPAVSSTPLVVLSKTNPLVGQFHHAPVAGNWVAALNMESQIVSAPTLCQQQAFRRNPYIGCMAPTTQQLKRLHKLKEEMEAEQHARLVASRPSVTSKHVPQAHSADVGSFGIAPYSRKLTTMYELGDFLGAGAFGQVFLARTIGHRRDSPGLGSTPATCTTISSGSADCFRHPALQRRRDSPASHGEFKDVGPTDDDLLTTGSPTMLNDDAARDYDLVVKIVKKRILRTPELVQSLVRETEIHSRLMHRNIVRLVDLFETADAVYIVMERVRGKDLGTYLATKRRLSEVEAAVLLKQLLVALEYLHTLDVVHCDIKPANILLDDVKRGQGATFGKYKSVQLCDFGAAKQSTDPRYFAQTGSVSLVPCKTTVGTSGYIAPEVLQHRPYGSKADLWSVGVIMYQMLAGFDPFFPYSACVKESVPFPARPWASISREAVDLVSALLTVNPTERITAQAALLHPWFQRA